MNIKIDEENSRENRALIVKSVLANLSDWFGLPESTKEYIDNCQNYKMWVAFDNNQPIGFISLKETSEEVAEIYCMGVKKEYQHQGIGKKLFNYFETYSTQKYSFLQVKTVAKGTYDIYDRTIDFYETIGFVEFEIFPTLWDAHNPCLIMIKNL